jgi:hypothetical protein
MELVVVGRLLDPGLPAPLPGVVYVVSLMHYEVVRVLTGEYPHPSIYVGHHLPDLGGEEFRTGVLHRLRLTSEFPPHATILDKFRTEVSASSPFFCAAFEVVADAGS